MTKDALKMALIAMDTWKDIDVLKARKMCKEALKQPAWQELTDDEISKMAKHQSNSILIDLIKDDDWNKGCTQQHLINFANAIEQALKEKNHG